MEKYFTILGSKVLTFFLILIPLAVYGGGSEGKGNDIVKIPSTTKVLDEETLEHLSSISEEGSVLVFNRTTPILESLAQGDVIVGGVSKTTPYGLAPRRIVSIKKEGSQIKVITKPATLEEVIEKGTIKTNEFRKIDK